MAEVGAQVSELVDDGGFGCAADLAPLPASVVAVAERALAAPQSGAAAVAFRSRQGPSSPRRRRVAVAMRVARSGD